MDRAELIERLERLTAPDRELDALIATTIGGYVYEKRGRDQKAWFYPTDRDYGRKALNGLWSEALDCYTASLDAAIALVEKVRPGWWWQLLNEAMQRLWHDAKVPEDVRREALPRYVLIALLRSLDTEG